MAVKKEVKEIQEQSVAKQLIHDAEVKNKRLFAMWLITFIAFIGLLGYTIYLLNDIGTIETTTNTQEIKDVDTIDNSNVVNGDYNG